MHPGYSKGGMAIKQRQGDVAVMYDEKYEWLHAGDYVDDYLVMVLLGGVVFAFAHFPDARSGREMGADAWTRTRATGSTSIWTYCAP